MRCGNQRLNSSTTCDESHLRVFFFQAEDGIRDIGVTGVQTCALPICQICMATSRHLVHESIAEEYTAVLTEKVEKLPVGDPFREEVALGPLIDAGQRDRVHGLVTSSVDGGATLRTGGTFEGLLYRPTVLGDVPVEAPAYREEIFGPVAPVTPFSSLDQVEELARGTEYGLSLGILTRDVYAGLQLAERIPSGLVHINDQTVNDEAVAPFGGVGASGTGSRHGGPQANIEAFRS